MKQLDFTNCEQFRSADRRERYIAFWGPLDETRRVAALVASDFFSFAEEANWQMTLHCHNKDTDPEKSKEAYVRSQMYCGIALEKFRLFGRLCGCGDDAETIERLERLIAYSNKTGWKIYPDWWCMSPYKTTAYFINQFKINAGHYTKYLAMCREAAEEKAKAKGKKKGGTQ